MSRALFGILTTNAIDHSVRSELHRHRAPTRAGRRRLTFRRRSSGDGSTR